ncbi:thiamine pyrophosphate-dependent enzyme [Myxococcota bacterium]|nr:thiamine pyrophosphate-dependent enzyme [Myxococcota bacterium]
MVASPELKPTPRAIDAGAGADRVEPPYGPLPLYRVIAPDGTRVGDLPDIDVATMLRMYRGMLLIRLLDERMMILQRQGRIGFYGACTGQEAPPIGTVAALADSDWIFPGLREGSGMLYRGFPLETYICQVYGNAGDVTKGRQMPSHQAARAVAYVSWGSCIGTQLPQATGAAWALKMRNEKAVTVGFMGDGATSSYDFHYALNFTGVYKAPCILVCQNNHWSISVPTARQTAARSIAEKAFAYGLPCARVDGNDVLAVYGAVKEARARALAGDGGAFLEMLTYRIGAHSSSDDPRVYRDEGEVEIWKKRDPLERFRKFLVSEGHWSESLEAEERKQIDEQILAAIAVAEARPAPPVETLFEDVFQEIPPALTEQKAELFAALGR